MPLAFGKYSGLLVVSWLLGMAGFSRGGFSVNHMDIAPKYAGPLMGISNTAGTLAGVKLSLVRRQSWPTHSLFASEVRARLMVKP